MNTAVQGDLHPEPPCFFVRSLDLQSLFVWRSLVFRFDKGSDDSQIDFNIDELINDIGVVLFS